MVSFDCNCCIAPELDDLDDENISQYDSTVASLSIATESSDDSEVLNTSYHNATPLFLAIEKENWEGVIRFLTSGKWSISILSSSNEHMKSPTPEIQVKTWVTSYDKNETPEWSQLPLHAAISYNAPLAVIRKLVDLYPKSVQCTDNEGMLPLHLAFGFGAPDVVLDFLLESFPASINERGLGGRLPYQCCELGPNKARGSLFETAVEQVRSSAREDVDKDWRSFFKSSQAKLKLDKSLDVSKSKLSDLLLVLLNDRKELEELKKRQIMAAKGPSAAANIGKKSKGLRGLGGRSRRKGYI